MQESIGQLIAAIRLDVGDDPETGEARVKDPQLRVAIWKGARSWALSTRGYKKSAAIAIDAAGIGAMPTNFHGPLFDSLLIAGTRTELRPRSIGDVRRAATTVSATAIAAVYAIRDGVLYVAPIGAAASLVGDYAALPAQIVENTTVPDWPEAMGAAAKAYATRIAAEAMDEPQKSAAATTEYTSVIDAGGDADDVEVMTFGFDAREGGAPRPRY